MRVSREKLYEEVWTEPMTKVAVRYEVSSTALKKTCQRLRVPHPPRGYWQRMEVGLVGEKPPLPPATPGDALEWARGYGEPAATEPWPLPEAPKRRPAQRSEVSYPGGEHPLIAASHARFDDARVDFFDKYLRVRSPSADLLVTREVLGRALKEANNFFISLERRGHQVALPPVRQPLVRKPFDHTQGRRRTDLWISRTGKPTVVFIGTVAFGLTVFEPTVLVEGKYEMGEWVPLGRPTTRRRAMLVRDLGHEEVRHLPSGLLAIRAYSPYWRVDAEWSWNESEPGDLPLDQIASELERAAKDIAARVAEEDARQKQEEVRHQEQLRQWRIEQEAEARREQEAKRQREFEASRQHLISLIEEWAQAGRIAAFIGQLQSELRSLPVEEQGAVAVRLEIALSMFGSTTARPYFDRWSAPLTPESPPISGG